MPASRRSPLLLGLAGTLVGALQVATTLVRLDRTHLLTVIATLQLTFCGSLLVVGVLVVFDVWREHKSQV